MLLCREPDRFSDIPGQVMLVLLDATDAIERVSPTEASLELRTSYNATSRYLSDQRLFTANNAKSSAVVAGAAPFSTWD